MPYILTLIGFVFLLYVISRFMKQSHSPKVNAIFRYGFAVILGGLGFLILVRGNIAVGGIMGVIAFLSAQGGLWRFLGGEENSRHDPTSSRTKSATLKAIPLSREEALDILGLREGANAAEVKEAHHRLMMKIHPDQGGSDYLATRINQARDVLLE